MEGMQDIKLRLASLGYTATPEDQWALSFLLDKTQQEILSKTNQKQLPPALYPVLVDMVCGSFLLGKWGSGNLGGDQVDAIVTQITEGDTAVQFAAGTTPDQKMQMIISHLQRLDEGLLNRYRRLRFR